MVSGFDVRPAVREQVESLGATFLDLGVVGTESAGGYAQELTAEQQTRLEDLWLKALDQFRKRQAEAQAQTRAQPLPKAAEASNTVPTAKPATDAARPSAPDAKPPGTL